MSAWKEAEIRISGPMGITKRAGWEYNHIGLVQPSSMFDPKQEWLVIHLQSGHAVARVQGGTLEGNQALAADIADAGDWSFDGLQGFRNMFPDAPQRVEEIVLRHRPELQRRATIDKPDPIAAAAIARLREDEERGEQ